MKRKIRLSETQLHRIIKESVKRILNENTGGTIRLYHSTTVDGFNGMMFDGYMDTKAEHRGECQWDVIWFSNKKGDYGNGIEISIEVPQELFDNKTFEWMNRSHVITSSNINIQQYGFRIEKIMGTDVDKLFSMCEGDFDEFIDRLVQITGKYDIYTGENFIDVLLRQFGLPREAYFGEED